MRGWCEEGRAREGKGDGGWTFFVCAEGSVGGLVGDFVEEFIHFAFFVLGLFGGFSGWWWRLVWGFCCCCLVLLEWFDAGCCCCSSLTDLNLLMKGKILVTSSEDFILIHLIPYLTQVYVISSHT